MPATRRLSKSKFPSAKKPAPSLTDRPLPEDGQPVGAPPAPLMTSCEFIPQGDGSYRAVPRKPQDKVTVREAARLAGYTRGAVYRLYKAEFIAGERQTPRKILIDVASLRTHLEAVRDPEFWTAEKKLRYWGV